MTSSSELERDLRRLKPHKRTNPLARRPDDALSFAQPGRRPPRPLVLDTTVYIDQIQRRFPDALDGLLRRGGLWHSSVAVAELALAFGRLDPAHPASPAAARQMMTVLARVPSHRVLNPTVGIWREAAIACGVLARLQGLAAPGAHGLLNDALIFFDARKHGTTVLTRNVADFDLLQQLAPDGEVLFYRI